MSDTQHRRQLQRLGVQRAALVRQLETLQGQCRMVDSGRGYDEPRPTAEQRTRMRALGKLIDALDTAAAALATTRD